MVASDGRANVSTLSDPPREVNRATLAENCSMHDLTTSRLGVDAASYRRKTQSKRNSCYTFRVLPGVVGGRFAVREGKGDAGSTTAFALHGRQSWPGGGAGTQLECLRLVEHQQYDAP